MCDERYIQEIQNLPGFDLDGAGACCWRGDAWKVVEASKSKEKLPTGVQYIRTQP